MNTTDWHPPIPPFPVDGEWTYRAGAPPSEALGAGVTINTERHSKGSNVEITVRSHASQEDVDNALLRYAQVVLGIEEVQERAADLPRLREWVKERLSDSAE